MKRTYSIVVLLRMALASSAACAGTEPPQAEAVKAAPVPFPTAKWDALLKKHVDGQGRVSYQTIDKGDVDKLYAAVAASSPKKNPDAYTTPAAKEAYYINAYNVLVWKNVLDRLPRMKSVNDEKASFFFFTKFVMGGDAINLRNLEGDIVRPQFKDPRVHMALNCASGGCPQLPAEAFTAEKLDAQLDREAKKFVAEKRNVDFDPATKTLKLSHIFDWYKDDFGKEPAKVIGWINRYRVADAQLPTDAKLAYVDYDWRLNDTSLKR